MTTLTAAGTLLTASTDDRTLSFRLLPFGEPGRTSLGLVTASAGSVEIPEDPATLPVNDEHDIKRPVGRFRSVTESPEGLDCVVEVVNTTAGNDALELAASGLRRGISVEIEEPRIRGGKLLAGRLAGAGLVVRPAFPSALLTAADTEAEETDPPAEEEAEEGSQEPSAAEIAEALTPAITTTITETITNALTPTPTEETPAVTASNLQAIVAALTAAQGAPAPGTASPLSRLVATLSAGPAAAEDPRRLTAAELDTITQADAFDVVTTPEYVGELWRGKTYRPRFTPLVHSAPLTAAKVQGWEFVPGKTPQVDDWDPAYTGTGRASTDTMTEIPTNEVQTQERSWSAQRLAGGHRLDRIHVDLPTPGFWEAYLRESTDDFARKLDAKVAAHLLTTAPEYTATGADAMSVWSHLLLAAAYVNDYAAPTGIILGNKLWRKLGATVNDNVLSFLNASLGLADEDGSFNGIKVQAAPITNTAWDNKITVIADGSTPLHTLAGGPVRVSAEVVNRGAIDHGVFGYYALYTTDTRGLAQITVPDDVVNETTPEAPAV